MKLMQDGQEALFHEDFEAANALTRQGMELVPGNPLPRVFLDSVILTSIQDGLKPGRSTAAQVAGYFKEADLAIDLAVKPGVEIPEPLRRYYEGGAFGMRGLGHLYVKH